MKHFSISDDNGGKTMQVVTNGPLGTLLGLANVDVELHGVRARRTASGRISSNERGHGETSLLLFYVDGKRSSRLVALARLRQHIADGERVEISGVINAAPFKAVLSA